MNTVSPATPLSPPRNFLGLPPDDADARTAGVIVLPVPFEETSTFGHGSRRGPEAVIAASNELELYDAVLNVEPYRVAGGIATLSPMNLDGCDGQAVADRLREAVAGWLVKDRLVIVLGGEHTSVVGAIHAHADAYEDLTVIQLDAHSDLRPEYLGSPWNHACAMARVLDFHPDLVQVGIRSQAQEERAIAGARNLQVFFAHHIHRSKDWIADVIAASNRNVYVTIDCDVLDPSIMPATGTPEPDGLTWPQIDALLARLCVDRNVVGFDVSELAPIPGVMHPEFTIAKLIYRFIGYRCPCRHRFQEQGG
ncbi:MAG: agmatinase [Candidatus Hydrogenedentes bacterium]|nr:agmatinase [Candidatus Hydrogenedentota bacterium]